MVTRMILCVRVRFSMNVFLGNVVDCIVLESLHAAVGCAFYLFIRAPRT